MSRCIRTCLGENLKRIRNDRGFTQKEFAKAAKISVSFLQNIESGKRWLSPDKIAVIARTLKVTESELFHDCEAVMKPDPKAAVALICEAFGIELEMAHLQGARLRTPPTFYARIFRAIPVEVENEFSVMCEHPKWNWLAFRDVLQTLQKSLR